jgi:hypothetical protein
MLALLSGQEGTDTPLPAFFSVSRTAVCPISHHKLRVTPWSTARGYHGPQVAKQRYQHLAIGHVGGPSTHDQRHPFAIRDQMTLTAFLRPIRGIGAGVRPPKTARTLPLSTTPMVRSRRPRRPSKCRSLPCTRGQTPACVQSRRRRQQVTPLPQPSSAGRSRHGSPVLSTKIMPIRQSRSETRGRPPSGLAGSRGNNGSISFQSSSGKRTSAMTASLHWL